MEDARAEDEVEQAIDVRIESVETDSRGRRRYTAVATLGTGAAEGSEAPNTVGRAVFVELADTPWSGQALARSPKRDPTSKI